MTGRGFNGGLQGMGIIRVLGTTCRHIRGYGRKRRSTLLTINPAD
jgi:hypothetical protein